MSGSDGPGAPVQPTPVVALKGITKRFGGVTALRGVELAAWAGEVHALVGENGAGKSTLIKILAGAVPKDSGELRFDGRSTDLAGPSDARRLGIRVVYQDFSLVPDMTVGENLVLGHWATLPAGFVDWKETYARAERILAHVGFTLNVRQPLHSLRVAEKQMLEVAKAVAEEPRLLILDEPTAVLEEEQIAQLFAVIRRLRAAGTGIIYISHRLDEVFALADRVTVLKDGEVVATLLASETNKEQLIKLMVGRALSEIYPARSGGRGRSLVEVRNLSCGTRLRDATFHVREGEILGLAGLVGSGRTEVARCIFGADRVTGGEILVDGRPTVFRSPREAINRGIALLTEDRKKDGLLLDMAIGHNISIASLSRLSRSGVIEQTQERRINGDAIDKLSIRPPDPHRPVRQLSGGNQQKVAFAKWLVTKSRVLVLDQPTWGVDVGTMVEIYKLIGELADRGKAIILISSVLPEILGLSDRIVVMREGRTVAEIPHQEATEERILAQAMGVGR